jgi:hypothetical protein
MWRKGVFLKQCVRKRKEKGGDEERNGQTETVEEGERKCEGKKGESQNGRRRRRCSK